MSGVSLPDLNLVNAECRLVTEALARTGSLVEAAKLLGTNRHALRRLITKHGVQWWPYAQQQERHSDHGQATAGEAVSACVGRPRGRE
jgi:hypothetical protein